ncbi:MAG: ATP-binding cassette domain-containing protein [Verrucomicrobiales bacterium]
MDTLVEPKTTAARPHEPLTGLGAVLTVRRRWWRRFFSRRRRRTANLLPLLMQVFAGFSKVDGEVVEADVDSSLGFLRYDFPEALHAELQALYQKALKEPQNLNEIAASLANRLGAEEKILLGIQLYLLISRASMPAQQLKQFYLFMTSLGVASEAVGIVYQLNTGSEEEALALADQEGAQPLESLHIANHPQADLVLDYLESTQSLTVFRYQSLILLKNTGSMPVIARGRRLRAGEFTRLYLGQRAVVGEAVFEYQDLVTYLNAKKHVSSTQLFFSIDETDQPYVERMRSPDSVFEIKFALGVEVRALSRSQARVKGVALQIGQRLKCSLHDKITFPNHTEITLAELRRRAREMGGRFNLSPSKSEYLISTNPALLRPGDILLSPTARGELLLQVKCDYESKRGELHVLKANRPVFVRRQPVKDHAVLADGETIDIGEGVFLRCHFGDRIIEEERNIISRLEISSATHCYVRGNTALDDISLSVRRGEMICVMGPSGCGKSTLLRVLAGHLEPTEGRVLLNGVPLYENLRELRPYLAYIPHDDAFDPLLTVEENLDMAAAVRSPNVSAPDRRKRVDAKLIELGLDAVRHRRSGTPEEKTLSGGERKRLNIGLDMISLSDVFLFDEPTSGLSSKDSEHLLEIIRGVAHNKIVFVSIHQPSARLFSMFHKALLLDHGGRVVFFGKPDEMLAYFQEAADEEKVHIELSPGAQWDRDALQPEFIFDVLESPLRDLGGDIIYAEDERGRLAPARRFSPGFWRDRFQARRILEQTRSVGLPPEDRSVVEGSAARGLQRPKRHLKDEFAQLYALLRRAFLSKLRHRTNIATTLLEAPALAVLIATVLRYSEDGGYTFATAFHIPTYFFMTLVVGMFLGLTNSADDIVRDDILLQRERNHNIRCSYFLFAKVLSLAVFALVQCVIYLVIGNSILEIRDMFADHLVWMFLSSLSGVVFGLVISSLVRASKTAINLIPLILIPQIILGGALIKYEEMNRNLDLVYSLRRWLKAEDGKPLEPPNKLEVPFICQFMPLRWSYESIIIAQAARNPLALAQRQLQERIDRIVHEAPPPPAPMPPRLDEELRDAKDALAMVSGLEAPRPRALRRKLNRIMEAIESGTFEAETAALEEQPTEGSVSAAQIYTNQKVWDLFHKAENERLSDAYKQPPNVFFGLKKYADLSQPDELRGIAPVQSLIARIRPPWSTLHINLFMMGVFIVSGMIVLYVALRRKLTSV